MTTYTFWMFGVFCDFRLKKVTANSFEEADKIVSDYINSEYQNRYHSYKFAPEMMNLHREEL